MKRLTASDSAAAILFSELNLSVQSCVCAETTESIYTVVKRADGGRLRIRDSGHLGFRTRGPLDMFDCLDVGGRGNSLETAVKKLRAWAVTA